MVWRVVEYLGCRTGSSGDMRVGTCSFGNLQLQGLKMLVATEQALNVDTTDSARLYRRENLQAPTPATR